MDVEKKKFRQILRQLFLLRLIYWKENPNGARGRVGRYSGCFERIVIFSNLLRLTAQFFHLQSNNLLFSGI